MGHHRGFDATLTVVTPDGRKFEYSSVHAFDFEPSRPERSAVDTVLDNAVRCVHEQLDEMRDTRDEDTT